jgi:4-aminobutyrate aminotransferase
MIRTSTSGKIAAFVAEPIQGVGGFITPPREYFEIVHGIVKKYGGLFISDEVQTGWGRTGGKWFGIEQWNVQPDIITSAKSLGNGAPIGLTVARPEVADAMKGLTISTFGGNPVTATQAKAVIDFIDDHKLMINAAEVGAYLFEKLNEMKAKHSLIGDVRGMGLMAGVELVEDRETRAPAAAAVNALMEAARENRLMIGKGGTYGNVIRISPPLNISKSDVDEFALRFEASLQRVASSQTAGAAR